MFLQVFTRPVQAENNRVLGSLKHWQLEQETACFLCKEIPISNAVDEELLHSLQGGTVWDLLQWLGARFTLCRVVCTVLDDLTM